ncbi:MAG: excinuclease ABC subunit UvrC [Deltaproteobacteria bacterium]|jgi:excinuclease ABC subunit C|nr:excinuclease ABC subunit UvrC [Deltaproteobacteria bacterium]
MSQADLEEKLQQLPDQPGIYKFFSSGKKIIYVGKAKNLKNRVRSYFMDSNRWDFRIRNLVPNIKNLEWIITHTEAEALILEDQLIKTHHPKYNIQLKDDKSYPYFKLSVSEMYPRLTLVREIIKDGSVYFGPYVAAGQARIVRKVINRFFPLRQSKMDLDGSKLYKPCLNYQMNRCLAPCAGKVEVEFYQNMVNQVHHLLKGNYDELIRELRTEMELYAADMKFEEAAKTRDCIKAVTGTLQKQRVVSKQKIDRDVLALVRKSGFALIQVLFIRSGYLLSDDSFFFKKAELYTDQELIRSVLSKLYVSNAKPLPKEILLPILDENASMLEDYVQLKREERIKILTPVRGEKKDLIKMAEKNGWHAIALLMSSANADELVLNEVQKNLKLKKLPVRVECFDISNISGTNNVASMVVWNHNQAEKKSYRKYKIKSFEGANDYAAMEEVLTRRYIRLLAEEQMIPDLIIIDGGKGQLSSAVKVLQDAGIDLDQLDVIGLAKGRSEKRAGIEKEIEDYEYVVKPNRKNEIPLRKNSATLYFLQRIRDEAHRFAITFHRKLRGKSSIKSILTDISGIGAKKRKTLLTHFSSLVKIQAAEVEDLQAIKGISLTDAQNIKIFFRNRKDNH